MVLVEPSARTGTQDATIRGSRFRLVNIVVGGEGLFFLVIAGRSLRRRKRIGAGGIGEGVKSNLLHV